MEIPSITNSLEQSMLHLREDMDSLKNRNHKVNQPPQLPLPPTPPTPMKEQPYDSGMEKFRKIMLYGLTGLVVGVVAITIIYKLVSRFL